MEIWITIVIFGVVFFLGYVLGVISIYDMIRGGIKKGILQLGQETYRVSKVVSRNTRI